MVLAHLAMKEEEAFGLLHFSYDHPAKSQEMASVLKWMTTNKAIMHRLFMKLPLIATELSSGEGSKGPRIVPSRNDCFVSMAANAAIANGFTEIWIGATAEDSEYPDCSHEWIQAQNTLLKMWGLTLRAPLLEMTREQILQMAEREGWTLDAWSCYQPINGEPCLECNSCKQ